MILILSIIVVLTFSVIGLSLASTIAAQYSSYRQRLYVENAISAADAGISATIAQLNKDTSFSGFASEQELYSDSARGKATYSVSITTDAKLNKTLTVTGKAYKNPTDTTPINTKQVKAVATVNRKKIANSVIIGSGGMYMAANSAINKGNVYVRGQLSMESGTSIGTSTVPVTLNAANIGCGTTGAGSNWPQPCGPPGPLKMIGAGGTIYGNVCATDQASGAGVVGTFNPGCVSDVSAAPTFNKKAFVQGINSSGGTVVDASTQGCGYGGNYTVSANFKFTGDLNLDSPYGACNITFEGDVYITGNLNLGSNVTFKASDNLGTTRPTMVVNKGVSFTSQSTKILRNSFGTPMFLLTFGSAANPSCSISETVPSDTQQTCLTNDQARQDATPGAPGTTPGSGVFDLSGVVLYAYNGPFSILSKNLTWQFYAIGAQGASIASGSVLSTVSDDAPFGDLLYIPRYQLVEYKQL